MNRIQWRAFAALLALLSLLGQPGEAFAKGFSAIAVDAYTGKVLVARDPDAIRYPASITKVMTLYIVFQEMRAGRINKQTKLKVSSKASRQPPSKLGLKPGSTISVEDAIRALVTRSANDVAMVVAENIGGSEAAFAKRMTRTAKQLGMTRTRYFNPSGLPNPGQVTTARDIATLSLRIQRDFPEYYPYFRIRSFVYKGQTIGNHNKLLGVFRGTDGIKTGYTNAAGFNLTTSAARGSKRLVGVVLGAPSGGARNRYMMAMLEPLFAKASAGQRVAAYAGKAPAGISAEPQEPEVQLAAVDSSALAGKAAKAAAQPPAANKVPLPRAKPEVIEAKVEEPDDAAEAPEPPKALASEAAQGEDEDTAEDSDPTTYTAVVVEEEGSSDLVAMKDPGAEDDATREDTKSLYQQGELAWPVSTSEQKSNFRSFKPVQTANAAAITALPQEPAPQPEPQAAAAAMPDTQPQPQPQPQAETPSTDEWQVQIGAWQEEQDAKKRLDRAAKLKLAHLSGKPPVTLRTEQKGKMVYTARFSGFTSREEARNACRALSRKGFGCLPLAPGQEG